MLELVPHLARPLQLVKPLASTEYHTELELTTKHQQDKWHADEDAGPGEFVSRSGVIDM